MNTNVGKVSLKKISSRKYAFPESDFCDYGVALRGVSVVKGIISSSLVHKKLITAGTEKISRSNMPKIVI